ncbi:probable aquaporin TIP5-1 isoform X1 [Brachypodium distachyon]|uniref:probable aquaporin TIP5-1 isoform X1 n=1 Tax=Brachypodium distachyon TaxID=15368 RepID=UPI000D0CCFDE|nr:probable aquaporin TIP5-1 isoform X1 [Brachypodium distachyon]|eukprot:XP_024311261.1 probable aquaporin TIP5-1 isoform X1 [Brachypodium distachyon]
MASNLRAHMKHCFSAASLRSYLAEFVSTFLFVFVAVGSAMSARMLTPDVTSDASSLVATAVAQSFGLFAAVFIAADVSGGHVNPAVTFALAIGGHIAVPSAIFYWSCQLLGSTFACLVLHYFSAGQVLLYYINIPAKLPSNQVHIARNVMFQAVPTTRIAVEMTGFGAAIVEGVMTFMLVYAVHVAADPRACGRSRGLATTAMGSLVVGLVAGACVLAAGSLTGASMNPARSFGPAVVSGDFKNQAVYWVGPMIGAAVAALVHQNLVFPSAPEPLPHEVRHGSVETVVA